MQSLLNQPEPDSSPWINIAPLLDIAMARLGKKDHSAIVLRFFEGKDLKQVGAVLGVSKSTAKTRVSRCPRLISIAAPRLLQCHPATSSPFCENFSGARNSSPYMKSLVG